MVEFDVNLILKESGLDLLEKLEFSSDELRLEFINKIKKFKDYNINLNYINNDIKDIILIAPFDKVLNVFSKINWIGFRGIVLDKNKNKVKKRVYDRFLEFLKFEVGLFDEKSFKDGIFEKKEKFDVQKDLEEKVEKFSLDVVFDYIEEPKSLGVNDFVLYFNKRLENCMELLCDKLDANTLVRISKIRSLSGVNGVVSFVGLVSDMNKTKNGHLILTVEDKSGEAKCFVNRNRFNKKSRDFDESLYNIINYLCLDEGVGVIGKVGQDGIVWVERIVVSDTFEEKELKENDDEGLVVCLSDFHVGSKLFEYEAFEKFLDWISSNTSDVKLNEIAKKVKYILIGGDLIEGLGIYPGQENDVSILSTRFQYDLVAQFLSQIPKDKCIVVVSGNHDSNRLYEPQLKLSYDKAFMLYNMPNLVFLSNPSVFRLFSSKETKKDSGVEFYLYHGVSLCYYGDKIDVLREKGGFRNSVEVAKFLLDKRHLALTHGSTLYVPDSQRDPLSIKNLPDFFLLGHTHNMEFENYKGCTILNCGCFSGMSEHQERMGFEPDVGKCFLVDCKTRKVKIFNFLGKK